MKSSLCALLLVICFSYSCSDNCADIDCNNNGVCIEATCQCDDGYEGTNCELETRAKFLGEWTTIDWTCSNDPSSETQHFTIAPGNTINEIIITPLDGTGTTIITNVKGDSLEIPVQDILIFNTPAEISGEGLYNENTFTLQIDVPAYESSCGGLLFPSSDFDPCSEINCINGGTCIDGSCECPLGYTGSYCQYIDQSLIQELLDIGLHTPKSLLDMNVDIDSLYGKSYQGGLIFYVNPNDGSGLVSAAEDIPGNFHWGCSGNLLIGANGSALGTGYQNTIDIINECLEPQIVAIICDSYVENEYTDWFLPAIDELELIYLKLKENGYSEFSTNLGFKTDLYWSSTQVSEYTVLGYSFDDGNKSELFKENDGMNIRPIRAFN